MPPRIPRACRKPGCAKTTTERSGYCDAHRNQGWENYQQGKSRHQRGYGTKWDHLRKKILKRDKFLCQGCLVEGRLITATTVDHILAKATGGNDAESNLQALCWPCHRTKTAREKRGRGG
ncbi:HNH endonuclease [Arsenophonus nasoniae]|uniref:Putative HNH nuclease YajD n=1 Tax=Arsenophonus nasoniae TaxID=638 RepID=A0A4P7L010_9GAMM|nr:HNH endonuclease [Arsenophonus nasoniae]QBY44290.1 HNH endonuclease [Arsenophonus nasoniae]WGM04566.1 HNH endonuclease [Arsenophonus nasoniae]WGM04963.1 HNH endonuclease [Arsenophonus nasoniae]WGM09678.1 HNH endonuclease [Arsenophonus nasoniae]WGM10064.1 HNH endonuclease [Arsenophonus nasoniae]